MNYSDRVFKIKLGLESFIRVFELKQNAEID